MTDLLQLPQNERMALAIASGDSLDDQSRDGAVVDRDNPDAALAWDEVQSQFGLG